MKPKMAQNRPDDFQTPPEALLPLYDFLDPNWTIWECACGRDNLGEAMRQKGFQVISTDIKMQQDFLTFIPHTHFECIITNPPFSLKQEFLQRAYELKKPFAFLLPLTTFEGKKRQVLFKQYGLEVILFDRRINFETPSGKGSGSWFATAWFTWGLNIGKELTFVEYNRQQILI